MEKLYCPYCGELLFVGCDCEQVAAEEAEYIREELEESSLMYAWQQDVIDMYRWER